MLIYDDMKNFTKIMVAVDNSTYSMRAAKVAFDLSRQLDTNIAIVYVLDKSKALGNVDAGIMPQDQLAQLKYEADETLMKLAKTYSAHKPENFVPTGIPGKEIIHTAEDWGADLLVLGTHGRTGLKRLLMGSTAEHVIRHSPIPVLVVPSK